MSETVELDKNVNKVRSAFAQEHGFWRNAVALHLRSGEVIEVKKVLDVSAYTVVILESVAGEADRVVLLSKHAIDKAILNGKILKRSKEPTPAESK